MHVQDYYCFKKIKILVIIITLQGMHNVYNMITIPTLHHKDIYYMYEK